MDLMLQCLCGVGCDGWIVFLDNGAHWHRNMIYQALNKHTRLVSACIVFVFCGICWQKEKLWISPDLLHRQSLCFIFLHIPVGTINLEEIVYMLLKYYNLILEYFVLMCYLISNKMKDVSFKLISHAVHTVHTPSYHIHIYRHIHLPHVQPATKTYLFMHPLHFCPLFCLKMLLLYRATYL